MTLESGRLQGRLHGWVSEKRRKNKNELECIAKQIYDDMSGVVREWWE